LDAATGQEILALFRRVNRDGTTLVVVTHDETLAAEAGRVIHMLDGRIDPRDANAHHPAAAQPLTRL
jgi:putative ABC transport system ATP-binding protein